MAKPNPTPDTPLSIDQLRQLVKMTAVPQTGNCMEQLARAGVLIVNAVASAFLAEAEAAEAERAKTGQPQQ